MVESVRVAALNSNNFVDGIKLCWGHLKNWKRLKIVQQSKEWLERANALFSPTTFIAYADEVLAGMIEFTPQKLMKKVGLCPCRANPEKKKIESWYILGKSLRIAFLYLVYGLTKIIKVKELEKLF